ncbi:CASP C terminal-domain-containing protein [Ephemerocybe angulata]|uniref:Protein CASP n=1 Tax=Ephemerocybe angulata TaxID=980116 RepID=A0A8H6IF12_9AGAR|nr:CASP C terminal-domain-containing protein [Tulosesus angulatus]
MASSSNFAAALETWRTINLAELQKKLDVQGIEIVDNQKEGLLGRKALADKTKEFKKLPDAEKLNAVKGLLKAYQTEIDNITKRCKSSDNAFLHVYKVLAEAPDPYPLLEAAVDQAVRVTEALEREDELNRLREENAELRKKLTDLPSLEASKKKLDLKVEQLEHKMDDMIQEKVAGKANELHATYDERIRNYEEREQDLQKQITLANTQLRDLRASHDSNQAKLIDHSQRQDQEVFSKLAEVDMIVADLDRANSRIATVERRNEILRAEIETLRSGNETSDRVKDLESQISDLEFETERLSRLLEGQKAATHEIEQNASKKVEQLGADLQKRAGEIEGLKVRLNALSDYDEIKRELDIMKYVEFSGLDEEADEEGLANGNGLGLHLPDPNAEKANHQHGTSLETLLASKNRRMQEELTKFRILHGELQESLRNVEQKLDLTSAELQKQKELNDKLENDLFSIDHTDPNALSNPQAATISNGKAPSADTSILPIVTSQRDRFRQRNAELEEELRKHYQTISELRAEVKSLQADNLKLYEKVRYMQSYREDAGSSAAGNPYAGGAGAGNGGSRPGSGLEMYPTAGTEHESVSKYQTRYEETINPFEAFRGRRTVLLLTRPIMGSRRARTLFFIYAIGLHVLVMYTSYSCTASSQDHLSVQPNPYHP